MQQEKQERSVFVLCRPFLQPLDRGKDSLASKQTAVCPGQPSGLRWVHLGPQRLAYCSTILNS